LSPAIASFALVAQRLLTTIRHRITLRAKRRRG
jgi:hypothetical protein